MRKPFELRDVLRQSSPGLVKGFYEKFGIQIAIFEKYSFAKNLDIVLLEHYRAPISVQRQIEEDARRIALLSCKRGVDVLRPMVPSLNGIPWEFFFPSHSTWTQKVLWVWLAHPVVFDEALDRFRSQTAKRLVAQNSVF